MQTWYTTGTAKLLSQQDATLNYGTYQLKHYQTYSIPTFNLPTQFSTFKKGHKSNTRITVPDIK